jgi:hypothetical protein
MRAYGQTLKRIHEMCAERGLKTERFMAKKGDVLIWHADLMHGGAKIEDPERTRKSLVAHFMPLGVMPTFYDFSGVSAFPYPTGGYCLDSIITAKPKQKFTGNGADPRSASQHPLVRLKQHVPLPVRAFVRHQLDRLSPGPQNGNNSQPTART